MIDVVLIAPACQSDEHSVLLLVAFFRTTGLGKDHIPLGQVSHGLYSDEAVARLPLFVVIVSRYKLRRAHAYRLKFSQPVLEHHYLLRDKIGALGLTLVSKFLARL
jgi:hypothetical protein